MDDNERKVFWDTLCKLDGANPAVESEALKQTIKYPKYIFRYRPVNMSSLEALQENKLYFSSAKFYDDPFDTYLHIDWKKVKERIDALDLNEIVEKKIIPFMFLSTGIEYNSEKLMQILSHKKILETTVAFLNEQIRPEMQSRSYSICFGESGINENLWLKYADRHRGFCLVYDLENEENWRCGKEPVCADTNCIMRENNSSLYPIYYSTEKYDATEYAINCAIEKVIREALKNDQLWNQFISQNPMIWERERTSLIKHKCHHCDLEWRMLLNFYPSKNVYLKWIPDAVILGLRIDEINARMIVRSANMAGIKKILQVTINPNDELDIKEVPQEILDKLLNT